MESITQINLFAARIVINVGAHLAAHYLTQKSRTFASTLAIAHLHIIAYDASY